MSYSNSSTFRPNEVNKGRRGMYCYVPLCGSSFYNNNMEKTNIALFSFLTKKKNLIFTELGVTKYLNIDVKEVLINLK